MREIILKNVKETVAFGERLGRLISKGDIVALSGQLGSGKTTLMKGIAKGIGVKNARYVNSPSFVIVKEYKGKIPLYHFDVYRLDDPSGLETVGYKDFFYGEGATVIEWADKIRGFLPVEYLDIEMSVRSEHEREMKIDGRGERYRKLADRIILK